VGALVDAIARESTNGGDRDDVDTKSADVNENGVGVNEEDKASAAVLADSATDCGGEDVVIGGGGGAAVGGGGGAEVGAFLREPGRVNIGRTFESSVGAVTRDKRPAVKLTSGYELVGGVAEAWTGGGGGGALGGCMPTVDAVLKTRIGRGRGVERARDKTVGADTLSSA
jgi:hypothetical protein